ncbi:MAG: hypothetical protein IPM29_02035 [Planctomycetes bacterium]|nr:hypothetical protein [Planctomycetota bacterium]
MADLTRVAATLVSLLALAAPAAAQSNPVAVARRYLPPEHDLELSIDLRPLYADGTWDELDRQAIVRVLGGWFERAFGFPFDAVDHVQIASVTDPDTGDSRSIVVLQGTDAVRASALSVPILGEDLTQGRIHGRAALLSDEEAYASPAAGLIVCGARDLVDAALAPDARGGVPHPDVTELGAGPPAVLSLAWRWTAAEVARGVEFGNELMPEGSTPRGGSLRITRGSDGSYDVRLRIRFASADGSAQQLVDNWNRELQTALEASEMQIFGLLLRQVAPRADGTDTVVDLHFADGRELAAGTAGAVPGSAAILLLSLFFTVREALGQQGVVVEIAPAAGQGAGVGLGGDEETEPEEEPVPEPDPERSGGK